LLIECLALSPVSGTDDSDSLAPEREAYGQDSTAHPPESKVTNLGATVCCIFGERESGIIEHLCCKLKGDAVLGYVATGLPLVPLELQ
jgi:hypothetical protein